MSVLDCRINLDLYCTLCRGRRILIQLTPMNHRLQTSMGVFNHITYYGAQELRLVEPQLQLGIHAKVFHYCAKV